MELLNGGGGGEEEGGGGGRKGGGSECRLDRRSEQNPGTIFSLTKRKTRKTGGVTVLPCGIIRGINTVPP